MVLRHNVVAAQLQIWEELLTTVGVVVFLEIGAWFQIEFGHYYKIEYFEIGHFITQKKIHAVLENSLDINEGKIVLSFSLHLLHQPRELISAIKTSPGLLNL